MSIGESALQMRAAANVREGEKVLGFAFIAAVEAAAAGEPGKGPLNDPAVPAQPVRGLDAPAGDAVTDASLAEPFAQAGVVVAFTAVEFAGLAAAWATPGADH